MRASHFKSTSLPAFLTHGMTWSSTFWIVVIGAFVVERFAGYRLWPTDLWDHVNYGRFIIDSRTIPTTEPLLPSAEGARFVATAWLSQVLMAVFADTSWLGMAGLQFLYAGLVAVALWAVVWTVFLRRQMFLPAAAAGMAFLAVNWEQLKIIRPQLVGVTCFSLLLIALWSSRRISKTSIFLMALMFVFWANCHGSFAIGLTMIALDLIGRVIDTSSQYGGVTFFHRSRVLKERGLLFGVCVVAVTVNPFGPEIFWEVLRVGRHPNIESMYEWAPLSLGMRQGRATAVVSILWAICYAATPARRRCRELLPIVVFGVLAIWSSRMLNWFAPVVAASLGLHLAAIISRTAKQDPEGFHHRATTLRSHRWTIVNLLILAVMFFQTNLGASFVGRRIIRPSEALARITPVRITSFLANSDLPTGGALIPAEWAGFVMYQLGDRVQSYINLHVHVIPAPVWQEYLSLLSGPDDLSARLNRLGINLVVVDHRRHPRLRSRLAESAEFKEIYDDAQGTVFRRCGDSGDELKSGETGKISVDDGLLTTEITGKSEPGL